MSIETPGSRCRALVASSGLLLLCLTNAARSEPSAQDVVRAFAEESWGRQSACRVEFTVADTTATKVGWDCGWASDDPPLSARTYWKKVSRYRLEEFYCEKGAQAWDCVGLFRFFDVSNVRVPDLEDAKAQVEQHDYGTVQVEVTIAK